MFFWSIIDGLGADEELTLGSGFGDERPVAIHGFGDERPGAVFHGFGDERPSPLGVLVTDVGAVEAERMVDAADMGVKGEARDRGEASIILADFGGTSGGFPSVGALPARSRVLDGDRLSRWNGWDNDD